MSKLTNPETESSITCGFYNALGGDQYPRKYDALQMSSIFDGIIRDGIFMSIGDHFTVTASDPASRTVIVGKGKCWFNHTWTENDAPFYIECSESHPLLNRIDAIVIEVNSAESVRDNTIKFVEGTAASTPSRPVLTKENGIYQYPLCYIKRSANSTAITQSDIEDMIGSEETPFINGILETVSIEERTLQWKDQLIRWVADKEAWFLSELESFENDAESDFNTWYNGIVTLMNDAVNETTTWTETQKNSFLAWFQSMKDQLSTDAAGNIMNTVDRLEAERILNEGFVRGSKVISEGGKRIDSVEYPDAAFSRRLIKIFSDDFLTCTTTLLDNMGSIVGTLVKTFSSDMTQSTYELTWNE